MKFPNLIVWRMSASRPWLLKGTTQSLFDHFKYEGKLEYHLIESILVEDLSQECIKYAKELGYFVHVLRPAPGQGFAMEYALRNIINTKFSLKWEDDFRAEVDIPLSDCVELMEEYKHINQICFNKRKTMKYKRISEWNEKTQKCEIFEFEKEQRYFKLNNKQYPLVIKDRWWFGSSIWRTDFIKPIFKPYANDTHNRLNDDAIMPLAGFVYGDEANGFKGRRQPKAKAIEENVGCYIWGRTKDEKMVEHIGREDSLWYGKLQEKWKKEGRKILE